MFMRFRGGGIGHKGIRAVQHKLAEASDDQSGISLDSDVEMWDHSVEYGAAAGIEDEMDEDNEDEINDYGYNYDDNRTEDGEGEEEEDNFGEDDLGAEDGEGPADIAEEDDYDD